MFSMKADTSVSDTSDRSAQGRSGCCPLSIITISLFRNAVIYLSTRYAPLVPWVGKNGLGTKISVKSILKHLFVVQSVTNRHSPQDKKQYMPTSPKICSTVCIIFVVHTCHDAKHGEKKWTGH